MRGIYRLFNSYGKILNHIKMRNVEIKARVNNINDLIKKAKELSSSDGEEIIQHDTFYNTTKGRLKLRKFKDNSSELLYYERPDAEGPKVSSYEKCPIPTDSSNKLHTILNIVLGEKDVVKKKRLLFMVGQTRVHVDQVEDLGDFMELEVVLRDEQTPEEGEKIAYDLMDKLGIDKSQLLSGAYADMLRK